MVRLVEVRVLASTHTKALPFINVFTRSLPVACQIDTNLTQDDFTNNQYPESQSATTNTKNLTTKSASVFTTSINSSTAEEIVQELVELRPRTHTVKDALALDVWPVHVALDLHRVRAHIARLAEDTATLLLCCYTIYYILYTIYYILCTILYTIYYILYTIYCMICHAMICYVVICCVLLC